MIEQLSQLENIIEYHHAKIYEYDDIEKIRSESKEILNNFKKEKLKLLDRLVKNPISSEIFQ